MNDRKFVFFSKQHGADANVSKLKVKWQNLYNPDLNNVFVVPSPNATYKLLDRVMIVRSGYPVKSICYFNFMTESSEPSIDSTWTLLSLSFFVPHRFPLERKEL